VAKYPKLNPNGFQLRKSKIDQTGWLLKTYLERQRYLVRTVSFQKPKISLNFCGNLEKCSWLKETKNLTPKKEKKGKRNAIGD